MGFFPHLNLRKVRPRVPITERTQIPIAADSFAAFPFSPLLRGRTVFRTALIQRQNLFARSLRLRPLAPPFILFVVTDYSRVCDFLKSLAE
jgi:hypothetical protein